MFDIKKNHLGKRILSLAIMACMAVPGVTVAEDFCAPVIAEAGHRNADEERLSGQRMLEEHRQHHIVDRVKKNSYEYNVQKTLIEANPDKVNFDDGKHERWIDPLYIEYNNTGNAWSNGSVVIITSEELHLCSFRPPDEEYDRRYAKRKLDESNINSTSDFASVLAHEFAHFANKDTMLTGQSHKENIREELQADIDGMNMLDNVPEYSMGSMVNFHFKERWEDYAPDPDYPSNQQATRHCMDYVTKFSGGRVLIGDDASIAIDGKIFADGYIHGTLDEGNRAERTLYFAGQVASCMKHGIWHKENLLAVDAHDFIPSIEKDKKTLLIMMDQNADYVKYLSILNFPASKASKSLTGNEAYERDLMDYIYNIMPD